jgi:hypothetical protein
MSKLAFINADSGGGIAQRIAVHKKRVFFQKCKGSGKIHGSGGLSGASLLTRYADNMTHGADA